MVKARRMVERMMVFAKRCKFRKLLNRFCPLPASMRGAAGMMGDADFGDSAVAMDEDVDDEPSHTVAHTQAFAFDLDEAEEELKLVSDSRGNPLTMFSTYRQVFMYVRSVLQRIVPREVWGSPRNEQVIWKGMNVCSI